MGLGAFHRAHQAVYIQRAIDNGAPLSIGAVSQRDPKVSNQIKDLNYRYTVIERNGQGEKSFEIKSIASATGMDYDSAHQFVKETFCRKNGKGTSGFHYTMNMMTKNGNKINGKSVEKITEEHNTMLYYVVVKGVKKLRSTTTGSFIKKYSKGTYVVTVKGHAFTIKDGVVIGNVEDGKKMKKHIDGVWKIG